MEGLGQSTTGRRRSLDLAPVAGSAPVARTVLAELLEGTALEHRRDDAAVALSELVTNAVLHGREPLVVVLDLADGRLRVEVCDGSAVSPSFSMLDPAAVTGRGLLLVASCSDRWGVEPTSTGKTVWFELDASSDGERAEADVDALLAAWADDLEDPAEEQVRVVLTDLDTELSARAEAHVEALLRELVLVVGADEAARPGLQTAQRVLHAAAAIDGLRAEMKRQLASAVAGGRDRVDVSLVITRVDAEQVRDFASAVAEADRLSRAGSLLLEPAPRELSDARQAYLHRIIGQLSS